MALMRLSSPHAHGPASTQRVMLKVLVATVPGILILTWFFGYGTLVNILFGSVVALAFEALALKLRGRPIGFYLSDLSALVTAFLLCIALPPYSPWWLIATGMASAILLAKHFYGGLGYNPFNPAMVGYVILLISFPVQMTSWAAPRGLAATPGFLESVQACFLPATFDGITMATPLDVLKQNSSLLIEDLWSQNPLFGRWGGLGWEWVNIAFLAGGHVAAFSSAFLRGTHPSPCWPLSLCYPPCFMTEAAPPAADPRCFTCSAAPPCLGHSLSLPTPLALLSHCAGA